MSVPTGIRKIFFLAAAFVGLQTMAQDTSLAHDQAVRQLQSARESYAASRDDEAIRFGLQGLENAIASGDEFLSVQFKSLLGEVYFSKEDHKQAVFYFTDAAQQAEETGDILIAANNYSELGNTYIAMDAFNKAKVTFTKAFSLYDQENNIIGKINSMFAIGNNYLSANMLEESIEAFEVQLGLAKEIDNHLMQSRALALLAQANEKLGNKEEAARYSEMQLDIIDPRLRGSKSYALARLYLSMQRFSNARNFAEEAVDLDPNNPEYNLVLARANVGLNRPGSAERYANTARQVFEQRSDRLGQAKVDIVLAEIASENGASDESTSLLNSVESTLESYNNLEVSAEFNRVGAKVYTTLGQPDRASTYQNRYESIVRRLNQVDTQSRIDPVIEARAQQYEDEALIQIEKNKNQLLARQQERLKSLDQQRRQQLQDQQNQLQEVTAARQSLEEETAKQGLLLEQTQIARSQDQAELDRLQQLAELQRLQDEENRRRLQLAENERLILTQKAKIQASQIEAEEQQKRYLLYSMGVGILFIIVLAVAFFRTNKSRKLIARQNTHLGRQQKVIRKANIQLNRAHETMREALMKEQRTRAKLERANRELKQTQVQLVQSEKMSSLGQLTAGIAHEINNPINFVANGVRAMKDNYQEILTFLENYQKIAGLDDIEKIKKYYKEMEEDAEMLDQLKHGTEELINDISYGASRVTEIVNGLRTFSRHDEAEMKEANIQESIESALLILKNKYKNKVEVVTDFDPKVPLLECFPGQLNQAFVNLIGNAVDAIEDHGTITITTIDLPNAIEISIADDGKGMTKEVKDQIFVPFYTTKDVGQGTGLGLAITHGIVEKHKGKISVESELGRGTTFTIIIPKQIEPSKVLQES